MEIMYFISICIRSSFTHIPSLPTCLLRKKKKKESGILTAHLYSILRKLARKNILTKIPPLHIYNEGREILIPLSVTS